MAYIPSESLSSALVGANFGIWLERVADSRTALVCKIPETVIKALYQGAKASFLMATVHAESLTVLCLGLWIDDEQEQPFKVSMVNASEDDKLFLTQILETHTTTLHCPVFIFP